MGDATGEEAEGFDLLGFDQFFFGQFALGNIFIRAQYPDNFTLGIAQRHLGGGKPDVLAIGRGLDFFMVQFWFSGGHDFAIVLTISLCLLPPAHAEIVQTD